MLYAPSQVRTEPFRGDTRGTLKEIAGFCRSCLHKDYRSAMLGARINHDLAKMNNNRSGNGNLLLPAFDGGGVVTAAALSCMVEGAMQMLQGDFTRFQETIQVVEDQSQLSTRVQAGNSGWTSPSIFSPPRPRSGRQASTTSLWWCQSRPTERASSTPSALPLCVPRDSNVCAAVLHATLAVQRHVQSHRRYPQEEGMDAQNLECPPSKTPFVPVAVQACLL